MSAVRIWDSIDEKASREGEAMQKLRAMVPSRWLMTKHWTIPDWLDEQLRGYPPPLPDDHTETLSLPE